MANLFEEKMRKLQKINDKFEAESKDEKNWVDDEVKEERPFILEGKRISMTDLELLLEITVKLNMLAD